MRFFFYGTLGAGMDNPMIRAIRPKLGPARRAAVRGHLYALPDRDGWYPALLLQADGGVVEGVVHDAGEDFTARDLATLDAYEAFDPEDEAASQYVRREIAVRCEGAALVAQAYLFNAPLPPEACRIEQPSFAAFLAAHGFKPLAPRD